MYLDVSNSTGPQQVGATLVSCSTCKDWGSDCDWSSAVPCPKCRRMTYPNLGVNLPAGAAWEPRAVESFNFYSNEFGEAVGSRLGKPIRPR